MDWPVRDGGSRLSVYCPAQRLECMPSLDVSPGHDWSVIWSKAGRLVERFPRRHCLRMCRHHHLA